eukprot:Nitzschia sp. Nitz4//scaffold80_size88189//11379//13514//NITZ4_005080-RA/size88189-processed-gene-0.11-mRNA-1//1//CDS//3329558609//7881//frame0
MLSTTASRVVSRRIRSNTLYSTNAARIHWATRHAVRFTSSKTDDDKPGLFSIPGLHIPSDFRRLSKQAILDTDAIRAGISVTFDSKQHAVDTLYQLDEISKTICNVIDAAELCRNAHASEEWRDVANETFQELQQYMGTLNGDQRLYDSLATIHREFADQLTEEESRFCFLLKTEFELDGIHLPDEERENVQLLHSHVVNLETLWMSNITNARKQFWLESSVLEAVFPRPVLEAHGATYDPSDPSRLQLAVNSPISNSITSFAPDGDLRKQVYWESMTNTPENLKVMDALIHRRHELATALGFESYAARSLQDKMAKTPQAVQAFLGELQQKVQPQFQADMNTLSSVKNQVEGDSEIHPWDVKYYTKLIRSQYGIDQAELAPYFGMDNCVQAMQHVVGALFGIEMKEQDLLPGEGWDLDDVEGHASNFTGDRIRKFVFSDQATQQPLGTMYWDLHSRPGKYTHAAHFTVRCGCRVSGADSDFQLPVVALVCNMNAGNATLSTHSEVETLFHEMGHALHSLLSRTNFQHMAGTRAAMDFVETPSHWMEHYVWDPTFLTMMCRNPATGESLAPEIIQKLVASRKMFRCVEMQNQIVLSKFDQEIFGGPAVEGKPQALWNALHKQHNIPVMDGSHWFTNVGHFVTYGAGYYGYLYSQVFADAIWKEKFEGQPFERSSGDGLWKKMLIHGGARDAQVMLEDLLGHKPTIDNYITR